MAAKRASRERVRHGLPTRAERVAAGKALRDRCPRGAHDGWKAPANRADPVRILIQSSQGRLPQLVPIRYGRMMQSPFAFYRGAAAIMAGDLAHTARSGIRVQACGDCHLCNFGGFATPERRLVFDINDFDETLPAPWEWDVKRLAASFVIASRHNGHKKADARASAVRCAQSYRENMRELAAMSTLERWYQRLDLDHLISTMRSKALKKKVERLVEKETARSVLEDDFPKLAAVRNGRPRIKDNPPLIFHQAALAPSAYDRIVRTAFQQYRATLPDDRRVLLDRYRIMDVAAKVVGVGSVGTRCGIMLMVAGDDDVMFLQVKEARPSVLEPYAGRSRYPNHGQRVVNGQRLMQSASDLFLGWAAGKAGRHFYVRQLRDAKIKLITEAFDERAMLRCAHWAGWALARAHAKAGDAAMISGYLGGSGRFDEAIGRFATAYADQNEQDHDALLKAIRAGKVQVIRED